MIIAITTLLIVLIICLTVFAIRYIVVIHKDVNEYTLRYTYENTNEILRSIKELKEK